jgi:histone H2B
MAKGNTRASKVAKKSGAKKSKGLKRDKKARTFTTYISRLLKKDHAKMNMSSKSAKIVHSFVEDMFERIASEAASLARLTKRSTLGSAEVQTAVRLVLPAELAQHAMAVASKAISAAAKP